MMKLLLLAFLLLGLFLAATQATAVQDKGDDAKKQEEGPRFLRALAGQWKGLCRTWFQPGQLADESKIEGEIRPILGGKFYRHEYKSLIQGKPRKGEETLAFNTVTKEFEVSWIDDFHMSYAIMLSKGKGMDQGFAVTGAYDVAPDSPPWGWKTVYHLDDADHLTITSYNVLPGGEEAKAVEVKYDRVKE